MTKTYILKKEQIELIKNTIYKNLQKGLIESHSIKIKKLPSGKYEVEVTYWENK